MLNLGPDLGPVRLGSGPDGGSEPDCGNPKWVINTNTKVREADYSHDPGRRVDSDESSRAAGLWARPTDPLRNYHPSQVRLKSPHSPSLL